MKKTIFIFDCSRFSSETHPEVPSQKGLLEVQAMVDCVTKAILCPRKVKEPLGDMVGYSPFYTPTIVASADANMFFCAHAAARATSTNYIPPYPTYWRTNPNDINDFSQYLSLAQGFLIGISHHSFEKLDSIQQLLKLELHETTDYVNTGLTYKCLFAQL